jgi:thiol-disulfide isomerase/thioredoxin
MRRLLLIAAALVSLSLVPAGASDEKSPIGNKIEPFKLQDFLGAAHELKEWSGHDILVVAFLGTECPVAKLYGPRLAELAAEYEPKGVAFVAIDSNRQDTLAEMAGYARSTKIEFPFLKDPANAVADQFGAERTPEVFLLDKKRVVRYHGRIDDQYGVGTTRNEPKERDLAAALDELLAGKSVTNATTQAPGCHIGRVNRRPERGEITYARHIAPIVQKHCVACHRQGEIAPFTLTSHEDLVNWSATIREVVQDRRMPPWHADAEPGKFLNDRRLPDDDKKLLFDWIENGMPAGDPADLPAPREFTDGWQIPKPDLVVEMPQPYTVAAKGTVQYQYFPVDLKFDEDKWIVAAEARPGNRSVVHHLIFLYVPPGAKYGPPEAALLNALATFAPGMPAWEARPGMARRVPAGSKFYFQVHYTPSGIEATDLSRAGIVFAGDEQIEKQLQANAVVNMRFRIPPKQDNVEVKAEFGFGSDMQIISMLPHMHLRGKAFRIESQQPGGKRELVLNVPRYDFNWQNIYVFSQPLKVRQGTMLFCTATYDNSENNPANPDPTSTVTWGDQTWEEMLVAQFEAVQEEQDLRLGLPKAEPVGDNEFEVEFKYRPKGAAEAVYLTGTFNDWKPTGHKMEGPDAQGVYSTKIKLKAGRHEYKFVIDGKTWRADPGNPELVGDYGNSLLRIAPRAAATSGGR